MTNRGREVAETWHREARWHVPTGPWRWHDP